MILCFCDVFKREGESFQTISEHTKKVENKQKKERKKKSKGAWPDFKGHIRNYIS